MTTYDHGSVTGGGGRVGAVVTPNCQHRMCPGCQGITEYRAPDTEYHWIEHVEHDK